MQPLVTRASCRLPILYTVSVCHKQIQFNKAPDKCATHICIYRLNSRSAIHVWSVMKRNHEQISEFEITMHPRTASLSLSIPIRWTAEVAICKVQNHYNRVLCIALWWWCNFRTRRRPARECCKNLIKRSAPAWERKRHPNYGQGLAARRQ